MTAGAIGGAASPLTNLNQANASNPSSGSTGNAFAQIDSGEFTNLLISQLQNQDPLKPDDSKAILEQLSTIRNIESQSVLQDQIESLVNQNSITQAGALVGKQVEGLNTDNRSIHGTVTAVRVVDGEAKLELDSGQSLPIERVTRIANHSPEATPAASTRPDTSILGQTSAAALGDNDE